MSPIINTVTTTTTLSSADLMKLIIFRFSISLMLSQTENISVILISMKGQNNTMIQREPPAIEFITPVIVTTKTRKICANTDTEP